MVLNKTGIYTVFSFLAVLFLLQASAAPVRAQTAFDDPRSRTAGSAGSGGDLVPVESSVDGGSVSIGSSAQVVVLFRNDSGRPLQTGAIQLYPSSTVSANVSLNQCEGEPLAAGAVCAVALSVKGLQAGSWRIEMLMRHSGRARLVTATLSGQIEAGEGSKDKFISDIEAIPDELDFGTLNTSQPIIKAIVLRNITSETVDINAIYIEAAEQAGYSLKSDCESLEPGQACIVTLIWSPVLKGQASGVLLVDHSGPTTITSVNLDGEFDPDSSEEAEVFPEAVPGKGLLVASQKEIDFGGDIATTSAITVSLVNVGDSPITLEDIRLAGSDNGLSISKKGCAQLTVLEPVEACPLTISWSPVREGSVIDDIQVLHDGARGILVLPVRGESTAIISQDTKAVRLGSSAGTLAVTTDEKSAASGKDDGGEGLSDFVVVRDNDVDPASVLDGFIVTSHAPKRAIIAGPGGSRIVFDGEEVVIGGFLWYVNIRTSGVEFRSGRDKVLLLFDRSLSSVNRTSGQSVSGGSSSTSVSSSSSN
ncbi:MAG: choice-of-anchor D domain-containing protein [Rhodospirillales bacterium]|nr:choice-of-anchor D domain-containing protein [Rhodospirillales bacterium]